MFKAVTALKLSGYRMWQTQTQTDTAFYSLGYILRNKTKCFRLHLSYELMKESLKRPRTWDRPEMDLREKDQDWVIFHFCFVCPKDPKEAKLSAKESILHLTRYDQSEPVIPVRTRDSKTLTVWKKIRKISRLCYFWYLEAGLKGFPHHEGEDHEVHGIEENQEHLEICVGTGF